MQYPTIAIVGAGRVGSTTAFALMLKNSAHEIILVDVNKQHCAGQIHDLSDVLSFSDTAKIRAGTFADAAQAHIIIITAGKAQAPGQSRPDLLATNKKIVCQIISDMGTLHKDALIIVVTNPVDAITLCAQECSALPRNQIFGSGTHLDSQRLRGALSRKLSIAEQSIDAYVLGEHGETQFPVWSAAHIDGTPLKSFNELDGATLEAIAHETKNKAYEIIKCKGATFYGIAGCVADICESIVYDQKRVLPLSNYQENFGICLSTPVVLGQKGIERAVPIELNEREQEQLEASAAHLQKLKMLCAD